MLLIVRALEDRGIDGKQVARRAGLAPRLLGDPDARYNLFDVQRLWAAALEATQDPCFGLEVGRKWHPTSFHALGYAALASGTLYEILVLLVRYSRIISNGADLRCVRRKGDVELRLTARFAERPGTEAAVDAAVQAAFAAIAVLCEVASGAPPQLRAVTFIREQGLARRRMEEIFGCPIVCNAAANALVFAREGLHATLTTANRALKLVNERIARDYLGRAEPRELAERVDNELVHLLPANRATQANVAQQLRMSSRTLQRKLRGEGTTFRSLLDRTRERLAAIYSHDGTLSAAETAYLLGFAEERSFLRARRRWREE